MERSGCEDPARVANDEGTEPAAAQADTAKMFAELAQRSSRIMSDFMKRQSESQSSVMADEFGIAVQGAEQGEFYVQPWSNIAWIAVP